VTNKSTNWYEYREQVTSWEDEQVLHGALGRPTSRLQTDKQMSSASVVTLTTSASLATSAYQRLPINFRRRPSIMIRYA